MQQFQIVKVNQWGKEWYELQQKIGSQPNGIFAWLRAKFFGTWSKLPFVTITRHDSVNEARALRAKLTEGERIEAVVE